MAKVKTDKLNILCPYCNAVWDANMEMELDGVSIGCDSCGYGESTSIRVDIKCSKCDKVVYVKEGRAR